MTLYVLARNPTDSVTRGFLPAAAALGVPVAVLTDQPAEHEAAYRAGATAGLPSDLRVVACDVADHREVVARLGDAGAASAVFSNSDHLQVQAALAADWAGLPGKDWRAALRCKNKALMRAAIGGAGLDEVRAAEVPPDADLARTSDVVGFPCVLKPREGVASEDVVLVRDLDDLTVRVADIRRRRPGAVLVAEEYLEGPLWTVETLGDGASLRVLGGFRTDLTPLPHFAETRMTWRPDHPPEVLESVLDQLRVLGVGLGAAHTEFVVQAGRARMVEVNYRIVGDHGDFLLREVLGEDVFDLVLRTHLGEPLTPTPPGPPLPPGAALVDYVLPDREGRITAAPPGGPSATADGVRLVHRRLAPVGGQARLTGTNRDYLATLTAVGPDAATTAAAVADFHSRQPWRIDPA